MNVKTGKCGTVVKCLCDCWERGR